MCIVVCNKPFDLLKILTPFSRPARRARCFPRQLQLFAANLAAAPFKLGGAARALNEQQMAAVVLAVGVGVARRTALMAVGDHIVGDALAHALIEHEVFADKLQRQPCSFALRVYSMIPPSTW